MAEYVATLSETWFVIKIRHFFFCMLELLTLIFEGFFVADEIYQKPGDTKKRGQ